MEIPPLEKRCRRHSVPPGPASRPLATQAGAMQSLPLAIVTLAKQPGTENVCHRSAG